jgi:hypothetical protein
MRDEEQGRGRSEVTSFGSGKKMSFDATSPSFATDMNSPTFLKVLST